jgi:tetratricopeptide (TPR) repeat protein
VFIPIISRTYCDPKSFAWEHEFKAFVEHTSQDKFGLKVKLFNGNVANRVLPVRIHDLDQEDIKLCESVLGGVLRCIEFIYKESGVDKSLAPEDDEKKNLNNTKYRIQIIKVAHAIKEIILGMKIEPSQVVKEKEQPKESFKEVREDESKIDVGKPIKSGKWKLLSTVAALAILIIATILAYPKIFKQDTLEKLRSSGERISVVVMPFINMTNDTIWNVWQDGIQNELITFLTNYNKELKVKQIESINSLIQSKGLTDYASITPSLANSVTQKLDANILIYGSIKKAGSTLRLNTQLIDSKTEEAFKSFEINGPAKEEMIFQFVDSLKKMVKNFLIISKLEKEVSPDFKNLASTNSPEAYRYFNSGNIAFSKRDFPTAAKLLQQAIAIDSNFIYAYLIIPFAYGNQDLYEEAKKWCLRAYEKKDQMTMQQKVWTNRIYANYFETPLEDIKYLRQLLEFDDQIPWPYFNLGNDYSDLQQFDKAIIEYERSLDIYKKWDSKPMWVWNYTTLGYAYHRLGQFKKEKELYKKAVQDFPDDPDLIQRQAILSLSQGDSVATNHFIEKLLSILKENSWHDADIIANLAFIYDEANMLDKAEEYYRKARLLEPENPNRLNSLAWFLINKDRKINEGLELVDKALNLRPDYYNYLDTKGWGLYKQGKYQEALVTLEKSWNLKPRYNHNIYLHLEEAKKAVASQKNN